ncbi:MAG: hypothetical protein H0X25_13820 [Acidobacteriales bacterium]|nr:hypothetical protein [Terriglobales bacterium]
MYCERRAARYGRRLAEFYRTCAELHAEHGTTFIWDLPAEQIQELEKELGGLLKDRPYAVAVFGDEVFDA